MSVPGHAHDYVSTACYHAQCGDCRRSCKYCDAPCQHVCHQQGVTSTVKVIPSWVDQARGIARELYAVTGTDASSTEAWAALFYRIAHDPDLFWLRGEEAPPPGMGHP